MKRLIPFLLLVGCGGPVEGIPCTDYNDLECPTGYWCKSDLLVNTRWVCVEEESTPRPNVDVVGVYRKFGSVEVSELADSEFSDSVSIDRNYATFVVRLRNNGGSSARIGPQPPVDSDCCLSGPGQLSVPAVAAIAPGESLNLSFDVRRISQACQPAVPFTIHFSESEAGTKLDYTFDVLLEPYVDDGECDDCDYRTSNNCPTDE